MRTKWKEIIERHGTDYHAIKRETGASDESIRAAWKRYNVTGITDRRRKHGGRHLRVAVYLPRCQAEWLRRQGNVSKTLSGYVAHMMSLDAMV